FRLSRITTLISNRLNMAPATTNHATAIQVIHESRLTRKGSRGHLSVDGGTCCTAASLGNGLETDASLSGVFTGPRSSVRLSRNRGKGGITATLNTRSAHQMA